MKMTTVKELNSFSELADLYTNTNKTDRYDEDKEKEIQIRKNAREKFIKQNKLYCPVCRTPLSYVMGTNICTCSNDKCKGLKYNKELKDGSMKTWYGTVYRTLTPSKARYAERIYRDEE